MITDPFGPVASPEVYVPRSDTERALGELVAALEGAAPVVALLGPAGIGKTLLLRMLGQRASLRGVYLFYPGLDLGELCSLALQELREPRSADPVNALLEAAARSAAQGCPLAILCDDAEGMPEETARGLLELSRRGEGSLRFVLALAHGREPRWLRMRFASSIPQVKLMAAMSVDETASYVLQRLEMASADTATRACFDVATLERIARRSGGVPSLVHLEADKVILARARRRHWGEPVGEIDLHAAQPPAPAPPPLAPELREAGPETPEEEESLEAESAREEPAEAEPVEAAQEETVEVESAASGGDPFETEPVVAVEVESNEAEPWTVLEVDSVEAESEASGGEATAAERTEADAVAPEGEAPIEGEEPETPSPLGVSLEQPPRFSLPSRTIDPRRWRAELLSPLAERRVAAGWLLLAFLAGGATVGLLDHVFAPDRDPSLAAGTSAVVGSEAGASSPEPAPPAVPAAAEATVEAAAPKPPPARARSAVPAPEPVAPEQPDLAAARRSPPPAPAPSPPVEAVPPPPDVLVSVNASPWAIIEVDGEKLGETPIGDLKLTPGVHRFVARMPDGRVLERTVEIADDRRHITFP